MPIDPNQLPNDPKILRKIVVDLTAQMERDQARLTKVERLLTQLIEAKTGRRSEQLSPDQLALFAGEAKQEIPDAIESQTADAGQDKPGEDDSTPPANSGGGDARKGKAVRRPLPPHLKRERILHDLTEAEKHCSQCQQDLRPMGEETSERYEFIPAQVMVVEDVCRKYACACTIHTATKPPQPIERSTAGASLLAQVIVAKHADHLPVHRQLRMFRRVGVELSAETVCGWMKQCTDLLMPLYGKLKQFVFGSKVVGTDDTPVKVLDRNLPQTRKGRIWPYVGDADHPAVVFDYTQTRGRAGPEKFLRSYKGKYLQADAYAAYDALFRNEKRGLVEVGCWAHARRHVYQARQTDARMNVALALIAQLYRVEKMGRQQQVRGEQMRLLREQGARPVLKQLRDYLLRIKPEVLPKSEAGQAIGYLLNHWTALTRYLEDGDLPIDNNRTERSLRGVAVGRGNWLFFGSDRGGTTAAVLRSFVGSCELAKVDPFAWFSDVLSRIAAHPVCRLEELLPHRWALKPAN